MKAATDARRAELAGRGDDGTAERLVRHRLVPAAGGATNATVVMDYLVASGYAVAPWGEGYAAEERREVASAEFDARCAALARAMQGWGWRYDGWDCPVGETGESER